MEWLKLNDGITYIKFNLKYEMLKFSNYTKAHYKNYIKL